MVQKMVVTHQIDIVVHIHPYVVHKDGVNVYFYFIGKYVQASKLRYTS